MSGLEAWAGRTLVAGGLVLLVGWVAGRRVRCPARRQAAGAWAVRGAVLTAAVAAFPGWLPVTLPAPAPAVADVPAEPPPVADWDWAEVASGPEEAPAEPLPPVPASKSVAPDWPAERWLAVGYAGVGLLLFGRLLLGQCVLVRLTAGAVPAPPRVRFPHRVLLSDRVRAPVCFGLVRPTVLLPRWLAVGGSRAELDWTLAHEADHLGRGDHRTAWWAGLATCLFFPLPWFWAVRRDLRLAQEQLADAAAAGAHGAEYAAFLLRLSDPPVRPPLVAAGMAAGRSDLYRRVTMLLSDGPKPRPASRRWRLLTAGLAVGGAAVLGGLTVREAAADEPKPDRVLILVRADDDKKPADDKKPEAKPTDKAAEVAKLKEQIKAAAKAGKADEAAELVEKLEKAVRSLPKQIKLEGKTAGSGTLRFGPVDDDGVLRFELNGPNLDAVIKQLEAQLDAVKDSPQARQAMEAALNALKAQGQRGTSPRFGPGGGTLRLTPRPRFGVAVGPVPEAVREQLDLPEAVGLLAGEVTPDTPAAKAGVKKGDILAKFGDKDVSSDPDEFVGLVRAAKAGKTEVVVVRKGKRQTLTVELPEAPKPADKPKVEEQAREQVEAARRQVEAVRRQAELAARTAELRQRLKAEKADGGDFRTLSVSVTDGKFVAEATNAGISYKITGKLTDGKAVPEEIVVKEGSQTHTGKAVADIPENSRNALERLLKKVTPAK